MSTTHQPRAVLLALFATGVAGVLVCSFAACAALWPVDEFHRGGDGAFDVQASDSSSAEALSDAATSEAAALEGSSESSSPVEACNDQDDNGDGTIDEGCDDDGDGYCDVALPFDLAGPTPAVCPNGPRDCDDSRSDVHPNAALIEGRDADCDGYKDYLAEIVVSVDDRLTKLCHNGKEPQLMNNAGVWPVADTYHIYLRSGDNVLGFAAQDYTVLEGKPPDPNMSVGLIATVKVNGAFLRTDGVNPPGAGAPDYTKTSPEWLMTPWRYSVAEEDGGDPWCDVQYDDSDWGPAVYEYDLGAGPWTGFECGGIPGAGCPEAFQKYYSDSEEGNEPRWIWAHLFTPARARFRLKITLP